jgi:hypothetical protein|tara:strand:+ start:693 stop:1394 length:702 start_codon:yes stop_codon:yes gene_type:complete
MALELRNVLDDRIQSWKGALAKCVAVGSDASPALRSIEVSLGTGPYLVYDELTDIRKPGIFTSLPWVHRAGEQNASKIIQLNNSNENCDKCEFREDMSGPNLGSGNMLPKYVVLKDPLMSIKAEAYMRAAMAKAGVLAYSWITSPIKCHMTGVTRVKPAQLTRCTPRLLEELDLLNPEQILTVGTTLFNLLMKQNIHTPITPLLNLDFFITKKWSWQPVDPSEYAHHLRAQLS